MGTDTVLHQLLETYPLPLVAPAKWQPEKTIHFSPFEIVQIISVRAAMLLVKMINKVYSSLHHIDSVGRNACSCISITVLLGAAFMPFRSL